MKIMGFVLLLMLSGCASSVSYQQAGSDQFSVPVSDGMAIVILESTASIRRSARTNEGIMLVVYARENAGLSKDELYEAGNWEFATYPGGTIPFYAGETSYGVQAFAITPGTYLPVRCVFDRPENEHCRPGEWLHDGRLAGDVSFTIKAGEVLNVGKLHVVSERKNFYSIEIKNNHEQVEKYVKTNWPSLSGDLRYSPLTVKLLRD